MWVRRGATCHLTKAATQNRTLMKNWCSWKGNVRMLFWQISGVLWKSLLCYSVKPRSLNCSHSIDCCRCYQSLLSSWCERWFFILDRNVMFYSIYRPGLGIFLLNLFMLKNKSYMSVNGIRATKQTAHEWKRGYHSSRRRCFFRLNISLWAKRWLHDVIVVK